MELLARTTLQKMSDVVVTYFIDAKIGRTAERRNDRFWSWSRSRRSGLNREGGNDNTI
jgi:hypothetical protein